MSSQHRAVSDFNRTKRVVDTAITLAAAPLVLLMGVLVALVVRLALGNPVFFKQQRIGLHEQPFTLIKFRSMSNARDLNGDLKPDQERLSSFGRWLRRASLDELPQLLNVLRGDMSLVGPRPLPACYLPHYSGREQIRHQVRPGLTGLAQVAGRNSVGWDQRLELDAAYVDRRSRRQDMAILLRTARVVLRSSGATALAADSGEPLHLERSYGDAGLERLRRLNRGDLPTRVDWINSPITLANMQIGPVTLGSTQAWFDRAIRDKSRYDFVLTERNTSRRTAMIGVRATGSARQATLYVFVSPQLHGLGFGTRATASVIKWLTREQLFDELTLTVADGNVAARRLYERLGFTAIRRANDRLIMSLPLDVSCAPVA